MRLDYFQVDAFTDRPFTGNPAAVIPLDSWPDDDGLLQAIAEENNLAETAFLAKQTRTFSDSGSEASPESVYHIRWFTPTMEVDLCGHATLAAAHVLFNHMGHKGDVVKFATKSGELVVTREAAAARAKVGSQLAGPESRLAMDFPARPGHAVLDMRALAAALGVQPVEAYVARDYMAVLESEEQVRAVRPDMDKILALDRFALMVTAKGRDCDFVSRFFAPAAGIPEDPVTGSAHCTLIPYWARVLNKPTLIARQLSLRGGTLYCTDKGERVSIGGHAVTYMTGQIHL